MPPLAGPFQGTQTLHPKRVLRTPGGTRARERYAPPGFRANGRKRGTTFANRMAVDHPARDETATREVAIFVDLGTRDGRLAVEVRAVQPLAQGFFASPRATIYSCAYRTQAERILALQRAHLFCDSRGWTIVHFGDAKDRRVAWQ